MTYASKGLRAYQGINAYLQRFTCNQQTTTDTESAKMQTHSATTVGFGLFLPNGSALWRPHRLKSRPRRHQSGGIALHGGPTRRRHAARRLRVVQNPHHHRHGERQGHGEPGGSARERQKPDNRTQGRPHFRYKTLPAQVARPHFRYKTLHAHPPSPHVRDKTLPARPKWPNLAQSTHAGRVLYRFGHQEPEQGEFCTEHKAELGLATTPQQAPQVRKAPGEPQEPAA